MDTRTNSTLRKVSEENRILRAWVPRKARTRYKKTTQAPRKTEIIITALSPFYPPPIKTIERYEAHQMYTLLHRFQRGTDGQGRAEVSRHPRKHRGYFSCADSLLVCMGRG